MADENLAIFSSSCIPQTIPLKCLAVGDFYGCMDAVSRTHDEGDDDGGYDGPQGPRVRDPTPARQKNIAKGIR